MGQVIARPADADLRLYEALAQAAQKPFDWLTHNCVSFACETVGHVYGVTPGEAWRERLAQCGSMRDIWRLLREFGFDGVEEIVDHLLTEAGFRRIDPHQALPANPVLVESETGIACGILTGRHVAVLDELGLGRVSRLDAVAAWGDDACLW